MSGDSEAKHAAAGGLPVELKGELPRLPHAQPGQAAALPAEPLVEVDSGDDGRTLDNLKIDPLDVAALAVSQDQEAPVARPVVPEVEDRGRLVEPPPHLDRGESVLQVALPPVRVALVPADQAGDEEARSGENIGENVHRPIV